MSLSGSTCKHNDYDSPVSVSTDYTLRKIWLKVYYLCTIVAITGPWIEKALGPHFDPLLRLFFGAYSLIVVYLLPLVAFYLLLRSVGRYGTFMALSLGSALTLATVALTAYWSLRLFGKEYRSVCFQLLLLSLIIFLFTRGKKSVPSERVFTKGWHPYLFWSLFSIFLLLVAYPLMGTGEIRLDGVVFPKAGDWMTIGACISAVVNTGIPTTNPYVSSHPIIYYIFYHVYSALFVFVSSMRVGNIEAGYWLAIIAAATTFCVFFGIIRNWLKNYGAALFSTALITVLGGFDCIPSFLLWFFKGEWPHNIDHWASWTVFRIMNPLPVYYWLPQHGLGALYFILLIYFLCRRFKQRLDFVAGVVCAGALLGYSSFVAAGAVFAVIVVAFGEVVRLVARRLDLIERREIRTVILKTIVVGIVGFLLVAPIYGKMLTIARTPHAGNSVFREIRLPEVTMALFVPQDYIPTNVIVHLFWLALLELAEFGPVLVFGLAGMLVAGTVKDAFRRRVLLLATAGCFLWVNSVDMGGTNPGECSSKCVGIILWWLLAVWSGVAFKERAIIIDGISAFVKKILPQNIARRDVHRPIAKALKLCFIVVLLISILSALLGVNLIAEVNGIPGEGGYPRFFIDDWMAYLYLRHHTPLDARVQRGPRCLSPHMMLPAWGWRVTPFSHIFAAREYMVDEKESQHMIRELEWAFTTKDSEGAYGMLKKYGVDYLLIGRDEIRRYGPNVKNKFDRYPSRFRKVWQYNTSTLYKLL